MAGIYIHIPFCKKACNYCNFHFSTSLAKSDEMVNAIIQELHDNIQYLAGQNIETVYLGGGTPSLLSATQLTKLCDALTTHLTISTLKEFTIECNPDDINASFLNLLQQLGFNRISLGIQSFKQADLTYMNRAHTAKDALAAIQLIMQSNFILSIDLIYGTPNMLNEEWKYMLETAINMNITHISAYALTVEPKTALAHQIKTGERPPVLDEVAANHFEILVNTLQNAGFEQYEISNFAKHKQYALHNTNYWKAKWYLGLGPSAHSFNGHSRSWNIANNALYIQAINQQLPYKETETLSMEDNWNEYILTSLRTMWGIDKNYLLQHFPTQMIARLQKQILSFLQEGKVKENAHAISLTDKGKLFADGIASELFILNH